MPAVLTDEEFLGSGKGKPPIEWRIEDDGFLNEQPPDKRTWAQTGLDALSAVPQKAGSFATGANDATASIFGTPVDILTHGINQLSNLKGGLNSALPEGMRQYAGEPAPQIENPPGGSASLRDLMAGTIGRTDPKSGWDRVLYGAGAGTAGAGLAPLAGAGLAAAGRAPTLAAALAGGAQAPIANAAMSAASGAGASAGEDAATAIAPNSPAFRAAAGTLAGLGAGGAVGAGMMAPRILAGARDMARPLSDTGQQQIAGRILNESATFGSPRPAEGPLGISPTLGDATNDPGIQALQRVVMQSKFGRQGDADLLASANNQTIRGALDTIGQPGGREPYQISAQGADRLDAIRQLARSGERDAWKAVDPEGTAMVPILPLRENFEKYVSGLTAARRRFVPSDYAEVLGGFGEQEPLREVADLRSMLLNHERQARGAGDYNRANVMRGLDEALFQRLPEGSGGIPATSDQAATARYQAATDTSRAYNDTYNSGPIRNIFRRDASGADVVPDSAALEKMLAPGQGQSERVAQYIRAAAADPEALQSGRDWFTAKMQQAGNSAKQDIQGDPFVLGNNLRKFVQANRPLIDSGLFTDEQRAAVDQIVDAATMVERTARARPNGSDTYRNLVGDNYISELVGGWMKPVSEAAPQAIGGTAGFIFGGPAGATAGAYGAGKVLSPIINKVYGAAHERVMNLLSDAILDPGFAAELMSKAPPSTPHSASPKLRHYLTALPVTVETAQPQQARQ